MPTYEYKCSHCDHLMEIFQSITASPKKKCPECGKLKLQRLIGTGAGLIFKGSGFYETDYRSDSYKKGVAGDKKTSEPAKTDNAKTPKTEAKKTDAKGDTSSQKKSPKNP